MKANSIKGNSPESFQQALRESLATGFSPTLAIVFMSVKQDRDAVSQILDEQGIAIYGATTNGEFIDEHFEQGTICALLLDMDPAHFFIRFEPLHGVDDRQITASLAHEAFGKFSQPAFLLTASNLQTDVEEMIGGILDVIPDANIAGGMAGDDHTFTSQYVFTNSQAGDRAIMVLVLGISTPLSTILVQTNTSYFLSIKSNILSSRTCPSNWPCAYPTLKSGHRPCMMEAISARPLIRLYITKI